MNTYKGILTYEEIAAIANPFYQSQRDLHEDGKGGSTECFPTSTAMGLSMLGVPYNPNIPAYHGGMYFADYLADICIKWAGQSYTVHAVECLAAQHYLDVECPEIKDQYKIYVFGKQDDPAYLQQRTKEIIDRGGVVVFPTQLAQLVLGHAYFGGHMILVFGYDEKNWLCHDPYGDANTNYTEHDGESVLYFQRFELLQLSYGLAIEVV